MAHEMVVASKRPDIISTLVTSARAWHALDIRHQPGTPWSKLVESIQLDATLLKEIKLAEMILPEYRDLLRIGEYKALVNVREGVRQLQDVVNGSFESVSTDAWLSHVENMVEHLRQVTGHACEIASIGTVDSKRKLFASVQTPLGFGDNRRRNEVYFSFLGAEKEGYSTQCILDGTVVVCGNTYAMVNESNSPIAWKQSHRTAWDSVQADKEVSQMIELAKRGVQVRIEIDERLAACGMSRAEQQALLAFILAASEVQQQPIRDYLSKSLPAANLTLTDVSASLKGMDTGSKILTRAVECVARQIPNDLGPDSRLYRDHAEWLGSQPGHDLWGESSQNVAQVITYGHTQRGHASNQTARANAFYFLGTSRNQASIADQICSRYAAENASIPGYVPAALIQGQVIEMDATEVVSADAPVVSSPKARAPKRGKGNASQAASMAS